MNEVTQELADLYRQLRDVTLSYNKLNFKQEGSEEYKCSEKTVINMKLLLQRAKILNHVSFSGMNLPKSQMLTLSEACANCPLLMGVHLNDNGINSTLEYALEVLSMFKIGLEDIPRQRLDRLDPSIAVEDYNDFEVKTTRYPVNIRRRVQMYMRSDVPDK